MKKLLLASLVTTGLCSLGGLALASEIQEFALDQMIVTATRSMKEVQEVPSAVSVVTAKDIEKRNIQSVPEALQMLPGVYLSQSPTYGGTGNVQIRGFETKDFLVLLDGVLLNTSYNNDVQWEMIPVENIERIEVVKGAGSSLYGGRAVAAVINIITKEATKKGLHGNLVVNYGSNKTWKKALYADMKVNEKVSFGVGYENRKSDGYRNYLHTKTASKGNPADAKPLDKPLPTANGKYILGGRGEKIYENETFTTHVKYDFDASKSLTYKLTKAESTYKYGRPWSNIIVNGEEQFNGNFIVDTNKYVTPSFTSLLGYDGKKESLAQVLNYKDEENKFAVNLGYVNVTRNGYSSPSSSATFEGGKGTDAYYPSKTYNLDIQKAWENVGVHTIVVGANYREESFEQNNKSLLNWRDHDSVDTSVGKDGLNTYNAGKDKNYAVFIQDEVKLSDPLTMYLGLRYDYYKKLDGKYRSYTTAGWDKDYESESFSELSPKVAFSFKQDENTNYYASYGHSFNPPPLYQVYRGGNSTSSYQANPYLEPETSDTFEIGVKKKLSNNTEASISLYDIKTKDKIAGATFTTSAGSVKKYDNFNKEERKGVELALNHSFDDNWRMYFNYAWQKGELEQHPVAGTNLKENSGSLDLPKHLLHAGINYVKDQWDAVLDCQYVSERNSEDVVTGEYGSEDAFFVVNAAFNYKINKDCKLQFAVNNIFDRDFYCSDMTPGRTYSVGLKYSF